MASPDELGKNWVHGLTGKQSNNGLRFLSVKKIFQKFIVCNRTSTGRKKGNFLFRLDPAWTTLKYNHRSTEDPRHSLSETFNAILQQLHAEGISPRNNKR